MDVNMYFVLLWALASGVQDLTTKILMELIEWTKESTLGVSYRIVIKEKIGLTEGECVVNG